jgi:hypothetical protein
MTGTRHKLGLPHFRTRIRSDWEFEYEYEHGFAAGLGGVQQEVSEFFALL